MKWVSVEEGLPQNDEWVLVHLRWYGTNLNDPTGYLTAYYAGGKWEMGIDYIPSKWTVEVTHWMEIEEPC